MFDFLKKKLSKEPTPGQTEADKAAQHAEEAASAKTEKQAAEAEQQAKAEAARAAEAEKKAAAEKAAEAEKLAAEKQAADAKAAQEATAKAEAEKAEAEKAEAEKAAKEKKAAEQQKADAEDESKKPSMFGRLMQGLGKTRSQLSGGLGTLFLGRKAIDDELLEDIETQLLSADVGIAATQEIVNSLTDQVDRKTLNDVEGLRKALMTQLADLLEPVSKPLDTTGHKPFVILMVGINGVGKTTTIGKLAHQFKAEGKSVLLAAGDTFRAAAVEQLQAWGERNDVPVIAQHTGADSASVLFDALQAAQRRQVDVLIADTAGRLHNKDNLMSELEKVVRVMRKLDPEAPHEVMLVLDAGTGQNAVVQTRQFLQAVGVTGLTLAKMDGTAKGGIIFALAKEFKLPVRYIGVGEKATDLRPFNAQEFSQALFADLAAKDGDNTTA